MISPNNCIIIRLDFGPQIGMGHLTRCVALADYFSGKGVRTVFISKAIVPNSETWISGYELFALDEFVDIKPSIWTQELDAELTLKIISKFNKVDWVILDSYSIGLRWERIVRSNYKLAVFEDFRDRYHSTDVLISESPQEFDPHLIDNFSKTELLVGPQFSILAQKPIRHSSLIWSSTKIKILITYGASDPTGESLKVINAVIKWRNGLPSPFTMEVEMIIGPHFANSAEIKSVCDKARVTVHQAPASIQDLLKSSHIVLTSGGNTMLEALNHCCLTIVTSTDENQNSLAEYLQLKGLILYLGKHDQVADQTLIQNISNMRENAGYFRNKILSDSPFDGKGIERIYEALFTKKR